MAKKKEKTQVINNIGKVNVDIDCDKLADAIVRAQKKAEQQTEISITDAKMTTGFFAFIANLFFNGAGWMTAILSVLLGVAIWIVGVKDLNWQGTSNFILNTFVLLVITAVLVVSLLVSIMMIGAAKEVKQSRDKNFVVSVFSSLTGLVALIVALIALFKGVG